MLVNQDGLFFYIDNSEKPIKTLYDKILLRLELSSINYNYDIHEVFALQLLIYELDKTSLKGLNGVFM